MQDFKDQPLGGYQLCALPSPAMQLQAKEVADQAIKQASGLHDRQATGGVRGFDGDLENL